MKKIFNLSNKNKILISVASIFTVGVLTTAIALPLSLNQYKPQKRIQSKFVGGKNTFWRTEHHYSKKQLEKHYTTRNKNEPLGVKPIKNKKGIAPVDHLINSQNSQANLKTVSYSNLFSLCNQNLNSPDSPELDVPDYYSLPFFSQQIINYDVSSLNSSANSLINVISNLQFVDIWNEYSQDGLLPTNFNLVNKSNTNNGLARYAINAIQNESSSMGLSQKTNILLEKGIDAYVNYANNVTGTLDVSFYASLPIFSWFVTPSGIYSYCCLGTYYANLGNLQYTGVDDYQQMVQLVMNNVSRFNIVNEYKDYNATIFFGHYSPDWETIYQAFYETINHYLNSFYWWNKLGVNDNFSGGNMAVNKWWWQYSLGRHNYFANITINLPSVATNITENFYFWWKGTSVEQTISEILKDLNYALKGLGSVMQIPIFLE